MLIIQERQSRCQRAHGSDLFHISILPFCFFMVSLALTEWWCSATMATMWVSEFGNSSHVIEKACIDLTPLRAGESNFSMESVKISYYHIQRRNDNGIMQYVCSFL